MKTTKNSIICVLLILVFVLLLPDDSLAQCAMCKKNAESSMQNGNSIVKGLNTGILYLMAVPYLMLAFIFREQIKTAYRMVKAKIAAK